MTEPTELTETERRKLGEAGCTHLTIHSINSRLTHGDGDPMVRWRAFRSACDEIDTQAKDLLDIRDAISGSSDSVEDSIRQARKVRAQRNAARDEIDTLREALDCIGVATVWTEAGGEVEVVFEDDTDDRVSIISEARTCDDDCEDNDS